MCIYALFYTLTLQTNMWNMRNVLFAIASNGVYALLCIRIRCIGCMFFVCYIRGKCERSHKLWTVHVHGCVCIRQIPKISSSFQQTKTKNQFQLDGPIRRYFVYIWFGVCSLLGALVYMHPKASTYALCCSIGGRSLNLLRMISWENLNYYCSLRISNMSISLTYLAPLQFAPSILCCLQCTWMKYTFTCL